jgi:hypothetical protein
MAGVRLRGAIEAFPRIPHSNPGLREVLAGRLPTASWESRFTAPSRWTLRSHIGRYAKYLVISGQSIGFFSSER